jgi:hypothetical protein
MRSGRTLRTALTVLALLLVGASWTSCSSSSNGAAPADAGSDADGTAMDSTIQEDSGCNPCFEVCGCTPGDTFVINGACKTITCGSSEQWGIVDCETSCPEAGDEGALDAECDPCTEVCACIPGSGFLNDLGCGTAYCPASGMWGGAGFCPSCDASSDGASGSGTDAPSE